MLIWLIEPLEFEFMRQAIAIGLSLGILGAVVGSYLILQQMGINRDKLRLCVVCQLVFSF